MQTTSSNRSAGALALATALVASAGLLSAQPALAQQTGTQAEAQARQNFDIPAGSLSAALNALARQAGLALTFDSDLAHCKTTEGPSGEFTPQQALLQLLAGTGLTYKFTVDNTATLIREPPNDILTLQTIEVITPTDWGMSRICVSVLVAAKVVSAK
jgi:hemoglobin/transferrin/lactoferrin receptor protein